MIGNGTIVKKIKNPTIVDYDGFIIWTAHRYRCKICGRSIIERNPFTFEGLTTSYAVLRRIMIDLRNLNFTYKDIASKNHVSPTIVQRYADSYINVPRQHLTESIGIDEISSSMAQYNASYLCVIVDNKNRNLLEILPTRSKNHLCNYFSAIPREERLNVKFVTIDLWEAYEDVAKIYFPNCVVAADPFHVIKHLTEGFARIRINIQNQVEYNSTTYYLLKKWHRLLEMDVNLDNEPQYNHKFKKKLNYNDIYKMLLEINENLTLAYHLKENYREFNEKATFENARSWLDNLITEFSEANIPEYREFTNIMINWKEEIINSFRRPYDDRKLTNAFTENTNGRIGAHIVVSRGLSNFERFRKRCIYALNDKVFYTITGVLSSLKRPGKPRKKTE